MSAQSRNQSVPQLASERSSNGTVTSYSFPDHSKNHESSYSKAESNGSATSLLIEYFEQRNSSNKPSVRVQITPNRSNPQSNSRPNSQLLEYTARSSPIKDSSQENVDDSRSVTSDYASASEDMPVGSPKRQSYAKKRRPMSPVREPFSSPQRDAPIEPNPQNKYSSNLPADPSLLDTLISDAIKRLVPNSVYLK
jgi:hypothetical protein